jgi:hypothetical protein
VIYKFKDSGSPLILSSNNNYQPELITVTIPDPQVNQISNTNVKTPFGAASPQEQEIYKYGQGVVRCHFQITASSTGNPIFTITVNGSPSNYEFAKFAFSLSSVASPQIISGWCGWCWTPDAVSGTNWSTIGGMVSVGTLSVPSTASTSVGGDFPIDDAGFGLSGQFSVADPANVASLNSCVFEIMPKPLFGLSTRLS